MILVGVLFLQWLLINEVRAKRDNIVFILADDLGFNDVSWHNPDIISPNLDYLARTGVILEQSYVQPVCTPTRASLMTGFYPIHNGRQQGVLRPKEPDGLYTNFTLMPQYLKKLGYRTHAIGKWHLGFCHEDYLPTRRGFDSFLGFYTGSQDYYTHVREGGYDFRRNETINLEDKDIYSSFVFSDEAIEVIKAHSKEHADQPLFLYLPFQQPHSPHQVPKRFEDMYPHIKHKGRRKHSAMISALDEAVGEIVNALETTGMLSDTLIVFMSDNGGHVGTSGNNFPLRGNKKTIWEGGTRAASFVNGKRLGMRGTVSTQLIHVSDWVKTLYRFAGGDPRDIPGDGVDQWKVLSEGRPSRRREMVYNIDPGEDGQEGVAAIRVDNWKLVVGDPGKLSGWYPPPTSGPSIETSEHGKRLWLFNLADDPYEHRDISKYHPNEVQLLKRRLASYRASMILPNKSPKVGDGNPKKFGGFWSPGWCQSQPEPNKDIS